MRCLITSAMLWLLLGGSARAELIQFLGPHPIAPTLMRGMCHIEGPHIHDYTPHKSVLYVQAPEGWAFVGDPTEFETEVPRVSYYGHHPVFWSASGQPLAEPHVCYISGPHHHWYAPPPELRFVSKGGAYWYVGPMPKGYVKRWHKHSPIDDYYGGVTLLVPRPVVTIAPPEGYVGFYFGPGAHHHGRYYGAGVHLDVPPPPSFNIVIGGGGGVFVPGHGHYRHGPPGHAWGARGHGKGKGKWK